MQRKKYLWPVTRSSSSMLLATGLVALAASATTASAALVQGSYTQMAGNQWSVAFTIANDTEQVPVHQFTIYFDESLYSNLVLAGTPATWDSIVIQPDTGLPAPGFLDGLVRNAADALELGERATGFQMNFHYLGAGTPGPLPFDLLDAGMQVITSGWSASPNTDGTPVPEPATLLLVTAAAMAAWVSGRRTVHTT